MMWAFCLLIAARAAAAPSVDVVANAASLAPPGTPAYGLTPGSQIAVFGNELKGLKARVTAGDVELDVPIMSSSETAMILVLPDSVPPGDALLTLSGGR